MQACSLSGREYKYRPGMSLNRPKSPPGPQTPSLAATETIIQAWLFCASSEVWKQGLVLLLALEEGGLHCKRVLEKGVGALLAREKHNIVRTCFLVCKQELVEMAECI